MAILRINGTDMPNPAELTIGRFDLTQAERAADGTMQIEIIRTDVTRLDVAWRQLTSAELQAILAALSASLPFFSVTYEAPEGLRTITCYRGDRNMPRRRPAGGQVRWDFEVALIER